MTTYGQFCPIAKASEILGERWTMLILREMMFGSTRFSELRRGLPRMSPTMLAQRLRKLESAGVITHGLPREDEVAEYRLTEAGERVAPMIKALAEWGHRYVPDRFSPQDLDPRHLMWAIRHNIRVKSLPIEHGVIRVEFSDVRGTFRFWWLLIEHGNVDLCARDPGYEVDLVIRSDVITLTRLFEAQTGLRSARASGSFEISGATKLIRTMGDWFGRPAVRNMENPVKFES